MTRFFDYVTSVGFRIELTKVQLRCIASIALDSPSRVTIGGDAPTYSALIRKGLVRWDKEKDEWALTTEGALLIPLLRAANLLEADIIKRSRLPSGEQLQELAK